MNWFWFAILYFPIVAIYFVGAYILDTISMLNYRGITFINLIKNRIRNIKTPRDTREDEHVKKLNNDWWMAFKVSLINFGIIYPIALMLCVQLLTYLNICSLYSQFNFYMELGKLFTIYIMAEIWFYISHRILHTPYLYNKVHKQHHYFQLPFCISGAYAHPFEFIFSNIITAMCGPILLQPHLYTIIFVAYVSIILNTLSHSCYEFKYIYSAKFHDIHHDKYKYNYGLIGIMDKLFDTLYK